MNKSLLIIICDFLLISVLALVEFKPGGADQPADAQALREQSAEEMLELLQLSLEHENAQRAQAEEALMQANDALRNTASSLEQVSSELQETESARAALAESLQDTRASLQLSVQEKAALETVLQQNEERARRLQEELLEQQQLAREKGAALATAQDNLDRLEAQRQLMSTELRVLDTEKKMLEQNLVAARAEVERARLEAERAQTRSENLAAGVSELAASSSALKEEIRQTQALSLNAIYQQFEDNRVFVVFTWEEKTLFSTVSRQAALQSLLVETPAGIYTIFATANTPLAERRDKPLAGTLQMGGRAFTITEIGFLAGEPGIAAVQVPAEMAAASGLQVFRLAEDPLRFATAVLVSDDQALYGEIPIRVPPGERGFLEVQTRLFNRLFGEFSPGPGDYVFSLNGELAGIMVRPDRARLLESLQVGGFIPLRDD